MANVDAPSDSYGSQLSVALKDSTLKMRCVSLRYFKHEKGNYAHL